MSTMKRDHCDNPSCDYRRALCVSAARFHAIVDKSADGVIVVQTDGVIRFVNPAAETLLGRPARTLIGEHFGVPVVPGEVTEVDLVCSDGAQRVAEMRVVETHWQDQPAFLATLRDITQRKHREVEIREAVRRRDQFLAMLSHELRNPLAAISNAAAVLHQQQGEALESARARSIIRRECSQMARLLDDLLDVCRISRGKTELRKEPLDLNRIAQEAGQIIKPMIENNQIDFQIDLSAEPLYVDADPVRLQQVFVNLLNNAIKYTQPGGAVWLSTSRAEGETLVRVADTGMGIPREWLEHIFDPFVQGNVSLDRSDAGLGIGLSLVRSLVELHGGSVKAISAGRGKGSEFVVRLPACEAPQPRRCKRKRATAVREMHILVVEDNANAREMLKALLELDGHEVATAPDGGKGLEMLEFQPPELALIDIGLPVLDGYELAKQVRANPKCDDVFLVALTGYGQPGDRKRALDAGFDAHLVKPLNPGELNRLVAEYQQAQAKQPTSS